MKCETHQLGRYLGRYQTKKKMRVSTSADGEYLIKTIWYNQGATWLYIQPSTYINNHATAPCHHGCATSYFAGTAMVWSQCRRFGVSALLTHQVTYIFQLAHCLRRPKGRSPCRNGELGQGPLVLNIPWPSCSLCGDIHVPIFGMINRINI